MLNGKKATPFNNIPCKSLKENANVCAETLAKLINNDISNGTFPDELKLADVAPIFKVDKSKKKMILQTRKITGQLVCYHLFQKYMNE